MTDLESLAQRGYTEGFLRRHVHDEYRHNRRQRSIPASFTGLSA